MAKDNADAWVDTESLSAPDTRDPWQDTQASPQAASTPEQATEELPFANSVMLALAQDDNSKRRYLEQEFGKDSVVTRPDGMYVMDNGVLKKANTGLMAELVAQGPEMAGGMAGRLAGGAAGFLSPIPGGAFLGQLTGGAVGSALAHTIKNKGLEALGLRSQEDAETAMETMTKDTVANLAIDAALSNPIVRNTAIIGGAGAAAYAAATAPEGERISAAKEAAIPAALVAGTGGAALALGKSIKSGAVGRTLAKVWTSGLRAVSEDVVQNAEILRTMVPGTRKEDWSTLMRSQEDAQAIKTSMQDVMRYNKAKAAGKAVDAIDPAGLEIIDRADALMSGIKKRAFDQFESDKQLLASAPGTKRVQIGVDRIAADFRRGLHELGALSADENGVPMIRRGVDPSGQSIQQIYSANDISAMDQVLKQLNAIEDRSPLGRFVAGYPSQRLNFGRAAEVAGSGTVRLEGSVARTVSFDEAIKIRRLIDGILERNGAYAHGDSAIGSQASGLLRKLREGLSDATTQELKDVDVIENGVRTSGDKISQRMNAKYSAFRDIYDNFALPSKLGDKMRSLDTIEKMLGAKGDSIEHAFNGMLQNVGINAPKEVARLQQLRAARNLTNSVSATTGPLNVARAKLGLNPRDMALATASKMQSQLSPIDGRTSLLTTAIAKGNQFVHGLSKDEKLKMMTTPALRTFLQTIYGAVDQYDQTQQGLMSGGQQ
jgi:hypothetical protein